ncbi:nitroreductase family protein [gamma proteobacterium HTCC5015]|nr:nitroreductase family protein [gamma proteobacterium HTCC5015]
MDAIDNLLGRYSTPAKQLQEPAPSDDQLNTLFQAAVTAPDHGNLQPWSFILIRGEARHKLGDVFAEAYQLRDPSVDSEALENYRNKPLRAPLLIAVVAKITPGNPKIPVQEQIISAACAAQHIQLGAQAMGFGSIWLTGINTRDWKVCEALGLDFDDKIVGYLYLGTPPEQPSIPPRPDASQFVREWTEPSDAQDTVI